MEKGLFWQKWLWAKTAHLAHALLGFDDLKPKCRRPPPSQRKVLYRKIWLHTTQMFFLSYLEKQKVRRLCSHTDFLMLLWRKTNEELKNKTCRALRLLRGFARFVSRLSALRGRSTQVQPLGEGHRLHPEELWEPDGAALTEGRAGRTHTHTHIDKGKKGTTLTRHGPLSTFVPFTDRFVFRQRVVVDGRGRGRTNGRPLGGSTHVLQPGLGEREGLRLQRNAAGANVASFWGSKKAEHHPTCKTKKEFKLLP